MQFVGRGAKRLATGFKEVLMSPLRRLLPAATSNPMTGLSPRCNAWLSSVFGDDTWEPSPQEMDHIYALMKEGGHTVTSAVTDEQGDSHVYKCLGRQPLLLRDLARLSRVPCDSCSLGTDAEHTCSLRPKQYWLNDELLNAWAELLNGRFAGCIVANTWLATCLLRPERFRSASRKQRDMRAFCTAMGPCPLERLRCLCFPYFVGGAHWVFYVAFREQTPPASGGGFVYSAACVDSYHERRDCHHEWLENLLDVLAGAGPPHPASAKRQRTGYRVSVRWDTGRAALVRRWAPHQRFNATDCGVHVMLHVLSLLADTEPEFSQADMNELRGLVGAYLVRCQLPGGGSAFPGSSPGIQGASGSIGGASGGASGGGASAGAR